ncbi:MAG: serine/threonine protein kinase [Kofleriaceae bacterium]|nr:serine/threonine protein kinase [Kofleriaceae bacterium]
MERAEADGRIGSVVDGRYRILEPMASGAMGAVYRAERVPVGKVVAIKFLHAAFASDREFLGRFERETRVMSRLAHPHCVSVVDFGVAEGAPYLVMDFVAGVTLRELLDDGPLEVTRAVALTRQVLAGLAHAHAQHVVHRDIKPANIMITEEIGTGEHVRILDFGLARLRNASVDTTQSHVVLGTPSYMAPEQTVGAAVDARADLYAVGIVLFEMLTGVRPFVAEETYVLLAQHRSAEVPRLGEHVPAGTVLPPGLQDVVDRALAKEPGARYRDAIEFADALDELGGGGGGGAGLGRAETIASPPRSRAPASRGRAGWLFLLFAATAVAIGLWLVIDDAGPRQRRGGRCRPRARGQAGRRRRPPPRRRRAPSPTTSPGWRDRVASQTSAATSRPRSRSSRRASTTRPSRPTVGRASRPTSRRPGTRASRPTARRRPTPARPRSSPPTASRSTSPSPIPRAPRISTPRARPSPPAPSTTRTRRPTPRR